MRSRNPLVILGIAAATTITTAFAVTVAGVAPAHASATPTCFDKRPTTVGTAGNDRIVGTSRADVIVGLGGDDTINGLGGDDLICAGDGADRVFGGAGDDRIKGGLGVVAYGRGPSVFNDVIYPGPGDDYVDPVADDRARDHGGVPDIVDYVTATGPVEANAGTGVVDATRGGEGTDRVVTGQVAYYGSPYADDLVGGPGPDYLNGLGGPDIVSGEGGDDQLFDDLSRATAADADVLQGGDGNDTLLTGAGDDTLDGGAGNDVLLELGETSADDLVGGPGRDDLTDVVSPTRPGSVDGGRGTDSLQLVSRVAPALAIDLQAGTIRFGTVDGHLGSVERLAVDASGPVDVAGTDGPERLQAAGPKVSIEGRGGDDWLVGADRDDTLDGGPGDDLAWPEEGTDTCVSIERTQADDRCEVNR